MLLLARGLQTRHSSSLFKSRRSNDRICLNASWAPKSFKRPCMLRLRVLQPDASSDSFNQRGNSNTSLRASCRKLHISPVTSFNKHRSAECFWAKWKKCRSGILARWHTRRMNQKTFEEIAKKVVRYHLLSRSLYAARSPSVPAGSWLWFVSPVVANVSLPASAVEASPVDTPLLQRSSGPWLSTVWFAFPSFLSAFTNSLRTRSRTLCTFICPRARRKDSAMSTLPHLPLITCAGYCLLSFSWPYCRTHSAIVREAWSLQELAIAARAEK